MMFHAVMLVVGLATIFFTNGPLGCAITLYAGLNAFELRLRGSDYDY